MTLNSNLIRITSLAGAGVLSAGISLAQTAAPAVGPLPVARPEAVGMSTERLQRIGQVLNADISGGRLPGAVIAVARKGRLVYYESFGFIDRAAGVPMPKDAIFPIASMTKPLTAVGALVLYEENRLLVHDPVGHYLPALDGMRVAVLKTDAAGQAVMDTEPAKQKATLQDLMRHTAGFTYGSQGSTLVHKLYPASSNTAAENLTGPQFIEQLGKLPLHYQPGTMWDYSFGLDVLGQVIEAVAKRPLGQHLRERVFEPLGMVDTSFVVAPEKLSRYAKPLPVDPDSGAPQTGRAADKPYKFECGGGCAYSTVADYLRFAHMLLKGGAVGRTRILGRKTVEYMTADHLGPEINGDRLRDFAPEHMNGYGFGLGVAVRRVAGRAGVMGSPGDFQWSGAQGTTFWVDPKEELEVVFMAVTPGNLRVHYRQVIRTLVLQAIVD